MAATALREPDRVPVVVVGHAFEVKFAGYTIPECLADADKYVDAKLRVIEAFGYDAVFGPQTDFAVPEALGSTARVFDDEVPAITEPLLASKRDLGALPDVDVAKAGRLPFLLEVTRRLKERVGPDFPVVGQTSLPFRTACMLRGIQNFYRDLIADPAFAKALLDYCVGPGVDFGLAMLQAGADLIFVTNPLANASCISRQHCAEFVHPYTQEMMSHLKACGAKVLFHICGDWSDRLDLVCAEGPDILHIDSVPNMGLASIKAKIGDKVCLMGNVRTVETLLDGSPEEVEKEARACIDQGAANGGFILSGDCSIARDTPPANMHALVRAANVDGTYPLTKLG